MAGRTSQSTAPRLVVGCTAVLVLGSAALPAPDRLPTELAAFVAVWLSICVQALPFLALGVLLSASIVTFLPADLLLRVVPRSEAAAVVAAGLFAVVLPGCECGSVPVANALLRRGTAPATALTFMLAAPAVNPVVLVSTAVAFPGQPMLVIARFLASMFAAWAVGWSWLLVSRRRRGRDQDGRAPSALEALRVAPKGEPASDAAGRPTRAQAFAEAASHDFLHAGGFLVVGAAVAAVVKVLVPAGRVDGLAAHTLTAVLTMAALAVLTCVCSEADAFVAASFTAFSPTAHLVFMTVSPMVDLKLVAMQAGTFGPRFVVLFAPLTLTLCIAAGTLVGLVAL